MLSRSPTLNTGSPYRTAFLWKKSNTFSQCSAPGQRQRWHPIQVMEKQPHLGGNLRQGRRMWPEWGPGPRVWLLWPTPPIFGAEWQQGLTAASMRSISIGKATADIHRWLGLGHGSAQDTVSHGAWQKKVPAGSGDPLLADSATLSFFPTIE